MTTQTFTILISVLALIVSIGGFLSMRQATWSMRYYERWFQLALINHCYNYKGFNLTLRRIPCFAN